MHENYFKLRSMHSILILSTFFFIACDDVDEVSTCAGEQSLNVESVVGIFLLTDTIPGARFGQNEKIIFSPESLLPLSVCNKQLDEISMSPYDSTPIIFSGEIQVLPETVDAITKNVYLTNLVIQEE